MRLQRVLLGAAVVLGSCGAVACSAPETDPAAGQHSSSAGAEAPAEDPTASPAPSAVTAQPRGPERFSATARRLGPRLLARMQASHRPGCPVPVRKLRYLEITYVGFGGSSHLGELVVHEEAVTDVVTVFRQLYDARWPIRRMRLVDAYGADDDRSMAANNTSAYNCRRVAGTARWSEHAYGKAIDLNPVQNPYVRADTVLPPQGRRYAVIDRSSSASGVRGVIRHGDVVVRAFEDVGWRWGGDWTASKDYQHFSATGR